MKIGKKKKTKQEIVNFNSIQSLYAHAFFLQLSLSQAPSQFSPPHFKKNLHSLLFFCSLGYESLIYNH